MAIVSDEFGGCCVLQSFFDGRLHVYFTQVLDLQQLITKPGWGEKYFDVIDRKDYVEKMNILLKWAWPIAQGNTVAEFATIC